jgi:hypothetical protein
VSQIRNVTVSGFANNRSMTFELADGSKQTLRISPWFKQIAGTKAFFEQVPALVSSGQHAQLAAAGYAASPPGGHAGQPQPQFQQQPQQYQQQQPQQYQQQQPQQYQQQQPQQYQQQQPQQYQQQQPHQPWAIAGGGFPAGSHVLVLWPDGQRYPATVVQEQGGHYLCTVAGGAQHWFPPTSVFPG